MSRSTRENDVFNYLDTLAAAGDPVPPLRKIRDEVGGGSLSTINRAVQIWRSQHDPDGAVGSNTAFPETFDDTTMRTVFEAIWKALTPHLNARLAAQKVTLGAELSRKSTELTEAAQELELARRRISELESCNKDLREELRKEKEARLRAEGAYEALKTFTAAK